MGKVAAKEGDEIKGKELHLMKPPTPIPPVIPKPIGFKGKLATKLSKNVFVHGKPMAMQTTEGPFKPSAPVAPYKFIVPPQKKAMILLGSFKVKVNGKGAATIKSIVLSKNIPGIPLGLPKLTSKGSVKVNIG